MHNSFYMLFIIKLDRRRVNNRNKACVPKAASYLNVLVRGGSSNSCLYNTAHISPFPQLPKALICKAFFLLYVKGLNIDKYFLDPKLKTSSKADTKEEIYIKLISEIWQQKAQIKEYVLLPIGRPKKDDTDGRKEIITKNQNKKKIKGNADN